MNHAGPDQPTGLSPHHVSSAEPGRPDVRITRFGSGASLEPWAELHPVGGGHSPWTVLPGDAVIESLNVPVDFARLLRDKLDVLKTPG